MIKGTGLGYRRQIADEINELLQDKPDFIELAPENWIDIGGYWGKMLESASEKYSVIAHGLSLSIGSPDDLDWDWLKKIKEFLKNYEIEIYSEHLSYSKCDNVHSYDLLPLPFREDAVKHITERIARVQDFLGMQLVLENVSYYTAVAAEMTELDFINSIIDKTGAGLLLDVNNVFVNAYNHNYDSYKFIDNLKLESVKYIHIAGHEKVSSDLIIDTHGSEIIDPVYELFDYTLSKIPPVPVLLERDFNIPEYSELFGEISRLKSIMNQNWNE